MKSIQPTPSPLPKGGTRGEEGGTSDSSYLIHQAGIARSTVAAFLNRPALLAVRWRISHKAGIARSTVAASLMRPARLAVRWRAAPSRFKLVAHLTARRTAGANGAKRRSTPSLLEATRSIASRTEAASAVSTRAASSQLEATRSIVSRTAEASGASRRAASSPLKATRNTACCMAEAGAASTWAAPRQLLQAARRAASRMEAASAASRRAAPRQSLKLQAARSARYVCGAHNRSPTVRRRSNPQDTTCHSAGVNARRSSGWRTSHKPVHG
jgi:hypothetical protein